MPERACGFESHSRHQQQHARNASDAVDKRVALQDGESGIRLYEVRVCACEPAYVRGDVAKWLRQGFAKPLFGGSIPPVASKRQWGAQEWEALKLAFG